jgi:LysM repeat protein
VPRRSFRHARRAFRPLLLLPRRWRGPVTALIGALVGGGVGVAMWAAVGLGYASPLVPRPQDTEPPPQAAASEIGPAEPAVPQLGPGLVLPVHEELSPFAGLTQPPPELARRVGVTTYVVQSGDFIWRVAEQFQLRPETILWANDLDDPDLIVVGQKLTIPPSDGVMYTVRPGDRLVDVANRYGVDVGGVISSNNLANPDQLQAGQDVFLPGGRPLRPTTGAGQTSVSSDQNQGTSVPLPDNIDELMGAGWLQTLTDTNLYRTSAGLSVLGPLPAGVRLERIDGLDRGRIQVRDAGDGRTRQAMTGWVDANTLGVGRAPSSRELPLSYPTDTAMDIAQVFAPYRSQLDGSAYAAANCGPTAIGMALNAFGVDIPPAELRSETLSHQHMWGNGMGTLITALADTVQEHGLAALQLHDEDGAIHRWTTDEIRDQVSAHHPVVVQVRYRNLPGRGGAYYFGDHYITITGVVDGGFLYNDPIDHDGLGWDRVISDDRLAAAMDAADRRYVQAAFAVGPPE